MHEQFDTALSQPLQQPPSQYDTLPPRAPPVSSRQGTSMRQAYGTAPSLRSTPRMDGRMSSGPTSRGAGQFASQKSQRELPPYIGELYAKDPMPRQLEPKSSANGQPSWGLLLNQQQVRRNMQ